MFVDSSSNDTPIKNLDSFLTTLDAVNSDVKGFVKLTDSTSLKFILYQISDLTNNNGWWKIDLTLQNNSALFPDFDNDENIKVSMVVNGTRGDRGPQGYQGYTGFKGFTGFPGIQGYTGYTGFMISRIHWLYRFPRTQRVTGYTGFQVTLDILDTHGFTGYTEPRIYRIPRISRIHWISRIYRVSKVPGTLDFKEELGEQRVKKEIKDKGRNRGQGDKGEIGLQKEIKETKEKLAYKVFKGKKDYTGFQGYQGKQGEQGIIGNQGVQGFTGFQGFCWSKWN